MKNTFLEQQTDNLLHSVPVRDYFSQKIIAKESPFVPISFLSRLKIATGNIFFTIVERILGSKIVVENELRELFFVDSRIRSTLISLAKKGIVSSWLSPLSRADLPAGITYRVVMNPIQLPSGNGSLPQGNFGQGSGATANEALIPALAELLERYSLFTLDQEKIIRGSFNALQAQNPVHPDLFSFFSKKQLANFIYKKPITTDTKMGWVVCRDLISGKKYLLPAQQIFILYNEQYSEEPYFFGTTTNGAAAGVSFEEATYRALCELFERDGFFNFWLAKIAPPVIDLESIPFPNIQEQIRNIRKCGLELFVLDITTDMEVPAFAAVILDRYGDIAVSVSTVAGFEVERSLEKLLHEAVQTLQYTDDIQASAKDGSDIVTFEQRRGFWSSQNMIPQISFFLQGKKKSFSEIITSAETGDTKTKISKIINTLKDKKYDCFVVDATSEVARTVGLSVVKVIIPQLVPVYFNESEKPLGMERLYTLPVSLGYRKTPLVKNDFNSLPHPFI